MTEQPTRDHLLHLVDRARRGVALPEELDQLATGVGALDQLRADLDRVQQAACRTAESLRHAEAATDGAYRERAHLVAHLAALHPSHIGHTDPDAPDWAVVVVETPAGQMSWRIAERDMDLFAHVQPTNRICRGWDGHTTDEKYQRMRDLTEAAPNLLHLEVVADLQRKRIRELEAALDQPTA